MTPAAWIGFSIFLALALAAITACWWLENHPRPPGRP